MPDRVIRLDSESDRHCSRKMLMHIIVSRIESSVGVADRDWHPPLFVNVASKNAGMKIERLSRQTFREFAPRKAPPFTTPAPGIDPVVHTAAENAAAEQASKERLHFSSALRNIADADTIFHLVPREAHPALLEIRSLLRHHFPEKQR
jgi:hypothetical protein